VEAKLELATKKEGLLKRVCIVTGVPFAENEGRAVFVRGYREVSRSLVHILQHLALRFAASLRLATSQWQDGADELQQLLPGDHLCNLALHDEH
jgi:hypothetical protein